MQQAFNLSMWISPAANLSDWSNSQSIFDQAGPVFLLILRIFLVTVALLGFGLYLWFMKISNDHAQCRLLNILNGYLSVTCMGLSPTLLLHTVYSEQYNQTFVGISGTFIIAVTFIFLLISVATILNHFKPSLYLDLSLSWRHKIAIPCLLFSSIMTENLANFSCEEKLIKCEVTRIRTFVMIPGCAGSFLCHLVVIIDDIWRWRNIFDRIRSVFSPNMVTPFLNADMEMTGGMPALGQQFSNPTQGLDPHLVSHVMKINKLESKSHVPNKFQSKLKWSQGQFHNWGTFTGLLLKSQ